jgi:hypothetical protein
MDNTPYDETADIDFQMRYGTEEQPDVREFLGYPEEEN